MFVARLTKIFMLMSCSLFTLLVFYGNLVDYNTNYQFVRHTLSMDTTFPGNALLGRAISATWAWTTAYWLIISVEALAGTILAVASIRMLRFSRAPARVFNNAKSLAILGAGMGFFLWFTGFMVIGGEWFAMWQSKDWNGQASAFRFYMTLLGVIIFVNQPDSELEVTQE